MDIVSWRDQANQRYQRFCHPDSSLLEQGSATSDAPASKQTLSWQIDQTLNNPSYSPGARALALVMLSFIIVSTVAELLSTMPSFRDAEWMDSLELVVIGAFTAEYLSRLVVCQGSRKDFLTSPLNVVDALAILPFYVEVLLGSSTKVVGLLRLLRVLRVIRVFRVFKAASRMESVNALADTMRQSKEALEMLMFFLSLGILLFSSLMFYAEGGTEADDGKFYRSDGSESPFTSIPETFWWAIVTMTTVGYGDTFPVEPIGKVVASVAMVSGIMVLALPISVIGNNFSEVYTQMQKGKAEGKANAVTLAGLVLSDDKGPTLTTSLSDQRSSVGPVGDEQALTEAGREMARHAVEMQRLANQIGDLLHRGKGPAARAVQLQFEQQRGAMKAAVDNLLSVATNADVQTVALGHDARDPTIS